MQRLRFLVYLLTLSVGTLSSQNDADLGLANIYLADPTIFLHDGLYYLYGTNGNPKLSEKEGFLVYTSKDLTTWEGPKGITGGLALKKGDAFGDKGFWAPQVFEYQNKFYMVYTANEHIAMAVSDSPLGPFINTDKEDLKAPVKQIDPFVFFDDDGKKYLYHVRLDHGNRIFVAELSDDLLSIKPKTLTECLSGELQWENTCHSEWPVTEGPTVLKHNNVYYLIYSANDFRNPDYAVGMATSMNPIGPWKKSEKNAFIHKDMLGINGPGHGDVLFDKNGGMQYVLHTHFSDSEVQPRRTAIVKISFEQNEGIPDLLEINKESFRFLKSAH